MALSGRVLARQSTALVVDRRPGQDTAARAASPTGRLVPAAVKRGQREAVVAGWGRGGYMPPAVQDADVAQW